jgi:hypothetical protein
VSPINDHDLDRLADYCAGLLDLAQEAEVDRLVAADPDWARAYADLTAAAPRLDAALSGLGRASMPTDVAEKLAAVLALQTPPAGTRTAKVIDLSARRRWTRRAAGLTAAAAVLAAIFGGITALSRSTVAPGTSTVVTGDNTAGGAAAPMSDRGEAQASPGGLVIRRSGTDYTAATLSSVDTGPPAGTADANLTPSSAAVPGPNSARTSGKQAPAVPAPQSGQDLSRLERSDTLNGCLSTIMTRYGGRPTLVDYARYQGSPALVVVLSTGGTRRIVVAGPQCGAPGAGPDERYTLVE